MNNKEGTILENRIDTKGLMTVKDVATYLKFHERTVWKMALTGEIPAPLTIGKKAKRWRRDVLEQFIRGNAV